MKRGFVKLYRKIKDNPVYLNPNCFLLFVELIFRCSYKDKWIVIKDQEILLKKGQAVCGLSELAKARGLTIQQVRTAFNKMKKWEIITSKSTNHGTVVTVCNFDSYNELIQDDNKQSNNQTTNEQQTANKPTTTNKNIKNVKNIKNKDTYEVKFAEFWGLYPKRKNRKVGKAKAFEQFKRLKEVDIELILKAVKNYALEAGDFAKDAERFLKNDFWRDYIENVTITNNSKGGGNNGKPQTNSQFSNDDQN